jgi:tryptophanyl-tRNA synthetase
MKKRALTGYRPTGYLHLGHYHGVLKKMLELQDKYECFFFVADWHALTTDYEDPKKIADYTKNLVLDWLAAGISPDKAVIYRQSDLPEVAVLALLFGMITPLGWLERNPTYKEQLRELKKRHLQTYGFIGYPVLQAADILIVLADIVPVGEDQVPHLELTREIARRFNSLYGEYFPEPEALLSKFPRVPGTDGRKMSKSYDNAIFLIDDFETIRSKVANMFTDPRRIYRKDPGHPDECPVFALHQFHTESSELESIKQDCQKALIGCKECKAKLAESIIDLLQPFQERRQALLNQEGEIVEEILREGLKKVKPIAEKVIADAEERMGLKK